MPPPKKAPNKPAKKAPKKTDGHHHDKHHQTKDLRRAYEHMGRVAVLRQATQSPAQDAIGELTSLAQQSIQDGHGKDAADLLRAAEHCSFATLAGEVSGLGRISDELKTSITEKFDELTRKADEHWESGEERSTTLAGIYQDLRSSASKALKARAYHQALEFARAAEALAHVKQHGPRRLERGEKKKQLKSA